MRMNRFEEYALGRPYHAALVDLRDARDPHGHPDFYEVMVVLDGAGRQDRGDGVQPLRQGEVLLIRPGDHHALSSADAAGLRFFNVAFPAAAWRTFADLSGLGSGWDAASTTPTGRVRTGTVEACHRVLERFYDSPTMLDLVRFWIDVMPVLHRAEPSSESTAPRWLAAACAAMRRPEHLRAGVPGLLSLAHVSPAHLARTMRRHYGVTPTEFVAQLRLRRAATLLAGTSVSITEIGADCGYASASYFTRCFHSAHRMSPSEFRRAARDAFVP